MNAPLHDASRAQITAARPDASTWLSANAGSGKTRVLTDRVARLLLNRVEPQHILCLTYTKAAAAEMQNRLFKRLGEWAMKPDAALRADLRDLGEGDTLGPAELGRARQLFARAIETPGGLRIQTIHSFCATLLRRYPLEAGVTPGFAEMDDRTAKNLRDDIVQEMSDRIDPAAVSGLATYWSSDDLAPLLSEICAKSAAFRAPLGRGDILAELGSDAKDTLEAVLASVFLGAEAELFARLATVFGASDKPSDQTAAATFSQLSKQMPDENALGRLESLCLTGSGAKDPFSAKTDKIGTADARKRLGEDAQRLNDLCLRVESARPRRIAVMAAEKTLALHRFARVFLGLYDQRKDAQGLLDFDDLIRKAGQLLNDPALAAWVLFRLDGGIDHILVDEAQDTSPEQWNVIEKLAAEFTAGQGASDRPRSLFVVGDKKQSIYSFQGANLAAFDRKRDEFGEKFKAIQQPMQDLTLDYSFRSSPAILQTVDAVFKDDFPQAMGDAPHHLAFFDDLAGRVDLWPIIPPAEKTADEDGWDPIDLVSDSHHTVELARQIAEEIRQMIETGVQIPVGQGKFRPVRAGDFLILVQRRGEHFSQIIRACKQAGLPIAGADRLKLGEEMAVKDLKALLAFLATPEDSLSLAAALRSPLFGWSENQLFNLAHGRDGHLWEVLRNSPPCQALTILHDLRNLSDFLRPYELIDRVLTRHGGRERLLARLGDEAEDGIDELLTQAMLYESTDVPSLTGFLVWLDADDVEVKRQPESDGGRIRVMTVHGAKGLEAPIVILPDTADPRPRDHTEVYEVEPGVALWKMPSEEMPDLLATHRDAAAQKAREERLRLLYVALTRARSWLIVACAGEAKVERKKDAKSKEEWAWYRLVEAAMTDLGAVSFGPGRLRYQTGDWAANALEKAAVLPRLHLAPWVGAEVPPAPDRESYVSPSDLGGAKALPGDGDDPETAKARGTYLHALLEYLPAEDPDRWADLARGLAPEGMDPAPMLAEAAGILADPDLAHLFGPDALSEVPVTGRLGAQKVVGTIDVLVVGDDQILAVDFKSNRVVPRSEDEVPEGILRQMGAYAHVLQQIWPDRRIQTALLWTAEPRLMHLDLNIVTAALGRYTSS